MSDNVTIHNGHCSYHGPAGKAPAWAARVAINDLHPPAPTIPMQIVPGPVPAQRVPDGASIAPELSGVGAHESHATRNENTFALKRNLSAPGSVRAHVTNAQSGREVSENLPGVGNTVPPVPLVRFEDQGEAFEAGFQEGRKAETAAQDEIIVSALLRLLRDIDRQKCPDVWAVMGLIRDLSPREGLVLIQRERQAVARAERAERRLAELRAEYERLGKEAYELGNMEICVRKCAERAEMDLAVLRLRVQDGSPHDHRTEQQVGV
ncbi:hypothetical protein ACFOHK_08315 [Falsigemmobacter intermedius]|uniref:Uncharacterized protein n=1 Tax=Falsigemmobacter intermedius TaxID=1553448 RepID=A0A3S4XIG7_9RHOB|nr:hypothetical protein [Falsigemmobacter intermedius]RWY37119.1 hypothetical protein EP867_17525 [Falsigemmobacter intermedius]